jgi:hypothetical protein
VGGRCGEGTVRDVGRGNGLEIWGKERSSSRRSCFKRGGERVVVNGAKWFIHIPLGRFIEENHPIDWREIIRTKLSSRQEFIRRDRFILHRYLGSLRGGQGGSARQPRRPAHGEETTRRQTTK